MVEYQIPYRNNWTTAAHCLCLIHPIDPRGGKIGGIETHVRLLLQHAPGNWRVLMVGVDGYGDCKLGELMNLDIDGRRVEFLPVIHFRLACWGCTARWKQIWQCTRLIWSSAWARVSTIG